MKRYLAFFGDNYYPYGGMEDFLSDHDNQDNAKHAILDKFNEDGEYIEDSHLKWGHVYDTVNKEIVYNK